MLLEDKIKQKYGTDSGMSVPDGYFEQFYATMPSKLPPYPEKEVAHRLSLWKRVQPYVYMAAMFAGIWLMMKVFHNVSSDNGMNLDNPPEMVAAAMADTDVEIGSVTPDYLNEMELESDLSQQYDSFDEFEKDFGYDLEPQYAGINIPDHLLD